MEKFFLKRLKFTVEIWQIGLLLIAAILGIVAFGALVEKAATDEGAPAIAKLSLRIARIPAESRNVVNYALFDHRPTLAEQQRFEGDAGFKRFKGGDDEALLLARFDGDENRSVVDIMDLESGAILHRYAPDIRALNAKSKKNPPRESLSRNAGPHLYRIGHPYLTDDGGLIFHSFFTPLTKIDACSNIIWTIDKPFHHSIEKDADGNFWTASWFYPPTMPYMPPHGFDDTIVQISPDGEILFEKSIGKILIENNLQYLVYSGGGNLEDPLHLNDVQPVMFDGPHWRRGDLFLSLRNRSAIMLYRPSNNKVIWLRDGPWTMQHDVDIINDHEIAVFDNNAVVLSWGEGVLGNNDTIIYDFATGEPKSPFSEAYKANDIRTPTEGRSEILPDGEIFVEEQNYGRLLKMNEAGELTWQYVNRAQDGRVYLVNWSRYINAESARHTAALAEQKCDS